MTSPARRIFLTGATGLLGRFILRELLHAGCRVTVLARDESGVGGRGRSGRSAEERIDEVVHFCRESLGKPVPSPAIVVGDIRSNGLGLSAADRRWLAVGCDAVVHAAASLAFRETPDGEPWAANVGGVGHLLSLCRRLGIGEFHHVSTAFVCGKTQGTVFEDDLERSQIFNNVYEESKCQAERLVRAETGLRSTIYRPSVIVGDSVNGYTSTYHGIYRFLELADRLAETVRKADRAAGRRRELNLRLPFDGNEPRNLVPVDWAARAIVELVGRPECHGRTYHLAARRPTTVRQIEQVAVELLKLEGIQLAGRAALQELSPVEHLFLDHLSEYSPYHPGDPDFDCRNLMAALPHLPPPPVDLAMLARLVDFAVADNWGRGRRPRSTRHAPANQFDCREYVEETFPKAAQQSSLARSMGLDVMIAFDVHGPSGGKWALTWRRGELVDVRRGIATPAEVLYRLSTTTFAEIVGGKQTPQEAFFSQRIEVEGDMEKALKLTVLFGHFLAEARDNAQATREEGHDLVRLG